MTGNNPADCWIQGSMTPIRSAITMYIRVSDAINQVRCVLVVSRVRALFMLVLARARGDSTRELIAKIVQGEVVARTRWGWQMVLDTGITRYQVNGRGKRRVIQKPGGYQPIDRHWLETGKWSPRPMPPRSPSAVYRPIPTNAGPVKCSECAFGLEVPRMDCLVVGENAPHRSLLVVGRRWEADSPTGCDDFVPLANFANFANFVRERGNTKALAEIDDLIRRRGER